MGYSLAPYVSSNSRVILALILTVTVSRARAQTMREGGELNDLLNVD